MLVTIIEQLAFVLMLPDYAVTVQMANTSGDRHSFQPCFLVGLDEDQLGRVFVFVSGTAAAIAIHRLNDDIEVLNTLIMRYGIDRLVTQLSRFGGADELFGPNQTQQWMINADDLKTTLLAPELQVKACDYQEEQGRDLYCLAADKLDETLIGSSGSHFAAPTSPAICSSCALPDRRSLCSHLSHPSVTAMRAMGTAPTRFLGHAMCNMGSELVRNPRACEAGGNPCWARLVSIPKPEAPRTASPLSLPEALDFLDAVWRLAGKGRLVHPSTFADAAGLVGDCKTAEEFESRLSDVADALDKIQVDKAMLPVGREETHGGLNRFKEVLLTLENVDIAVVNGSIATLQRVRGLRHTHQHSGQSYDRLKILRDLGISDTGLSWSETLGQVHARAVEGLLALRSEVRRTVSDSD